MSPQDSFFVTWLGSSGSVAAFLVAIAEGKFRRKLLVSILSLVAGLISALYYHPQTFRLVLINAGFAPESPGDDDSSAESKLLAAIVPLFIFGLAALVWASSTISASRTAKGRRSRPASAQPTDSVSPPAMVVDPSEWLLAQGEAYRPARNRKRLKTGCDRGI